MAINSIDTIYISYGIDISCIMALNVLEYSINNVRKAN
jgi:hypothetical protein